MAVQFESGALDIIKTPSLMDLARYKADPKYQPIIHPASGNFYLFGNNLAIPPLEQKKVRQALNYAIDRKRFSDTQLFGFGEPKSLSWPGFSPAYESTKANAYLFDLTRSQRLLSEAGVSSFELDINVQNSFPELVSFAQIYQSDLAKIGVRLNVRALDAPTWTDEAINRKYKGQYLAYTGSCSWSRRRLW